MRRFNISAVAVIIWILLCVAVMSKNMTDDEYKLHKQLIESKFRAANIECSLLSGVANNLCVSSAKAKNRLAKTELEVSIKHQAVKTLSRFQT